ncbi:hypothetical protein Tcan_00632, partial [Toxocara canis]
MSFTHPLVCMHPLPLCIGTIFFARITRNSHCTVRIETGYRKHLLRQSSESILLSNNPIIPLHITLTHIMQCLSSLCETSKEFLVNFSRCLQFLTFKIFNLLFNFCQVVFLKQESLSRYAVLYVFLVNRLDCCVKANNICHVVHAAIMMHTKDRST